MTFTDFSSPEFWLSFHTFSMLIGFHFLTFVATMILVKSYIDSKEIQKFKMFRFTFINLCINACGILILSAFINYFNNIALIFNAPYLILALGMTFSTLLLFIIYAISFSIILYSKNETFNES
jgi:hypothetical protein